MVLWRITALKTQNQPQRRNLPLPIRARTYAINSHVPIYYSIILHPSHPIRCKRILYKHEPRICDNPIGPRHVRRWPETSCQRRVRRFVGMVFEWFTLIVRRVGRRDGGSFGGEGSFRQNGQGWGAWVWTRWAGASGSMLVKEYIGCLVAPMFVVLWLMMKDCGMRMSEVEVRRVRRVCTQGVMRNNCWMRSLQLASPNTVVFTEGILCHLPFLHDRSIIHHDRT